MEIGPWRIETDTFQSVRAPQVGFFAARIEDLCVELDGDFDATDRERSASGGEQAD